MNHLPYALAIALLCLALPAGADPEPTLAASADPAGQPCDPVVVRPGVPPNYTIEPECLPISADPWASP